MCTEGTGINFYVLSGRFFTSWIRIPITESGLTKISGAFNTNFGLGTPEIVGGDMLGLLAATLDIQRKLHRAVRTEVSTRAVPSHTTVNIVER